MDPQPGDFGVTRIHGLTGIAVRVGQWLNGSGFADYEHAFIVMRGNAVAEAQPGGAGVWVNDYDPAQTIYSSVSLTEVQRQGVLDTARCLVGTPYSWFDYLSLALHRLHIRPRWVTDRMATSKHMICSQLVDYCYRQAGVPLFADGRQPGDVTPGDLYRVIKEGTK